MQKIKSVNWKQFAVVGVIIAALCYGWKVALLVLISSARVEWVDAGKEGPGK